MTSSQIVSQNIESVAWLTEEQAALVAATLAAGPGDPPVAVQRSVTLRGPLDLTLAAAAVQLTAIRHAVLRTAVIHRGVARPVQAILTGRKAAVGAADLQSFDAITRGRHAAALKARDLAQGFDLQEGPLLRVTFIHQAGDQALMVWTFHPAVLDDWSFTVALSTFLTFYERLAEGGEIDVLAHEARIRARQAPQFHEQVRAWQAQPADTAYWGDLVAGVARPTRPPALAPVAARPATLIRADEVLDRAATAAVSAAAGAHGLGLTPYLAAAWGLVLQRAVASRDVTFGLVRSGRVTSGPGMSEVAGRFADTIPVRVTTIPGQTVGGFLAAVSAQAVAQASHPRCDLAAVAAASGLGAGLTATVLHVDDNPLDPAALSALSRLGVRPDAGHPVRRAACLATAAVVAGRLELSVLADAPYAKADAERILARWRRGLDELASEPGTPVDDLAIIPPAERVQVLEEFNSAQFTPPPGPLTALVVDQAEASPAVFALHAGDRLVSRRELADLAAASDGADFTRTAEGVAAYIARWDGLASPGPAALAAFAANPALDAVYAPPPRRPGTEPEWTPFVIAVNPLDSPAALADLAVPLARGVPVVLADDEDLADPDRFARLVWRTGANVLVADPALLARLTEGADDLGQLAGLKRVVVTGADYPRDLARHLGLYTPAATWFRAYAPTGTVLWASLGPIGRLAAERPNLGRPLAGAPVYVLDCDRPCGIGQAGELTVAGVTVPAAGNLAANPFGPGPLLRTGDTVRWLPDGTLGLVGANPAADAEPGEAGAAEFGAGPVEGDFGAPANPSGSGDDGAGRPVYPVRP